MSEKRTGLIVCMISTHNAVGTIHHVSVRFFLVSTWAPHCMHTLHYIVCSRV